MPIGKQQPSKKLNTASTVSIATLSAILFISFTAIRGEEPLPPKPPAPEPIEVHELPLPPVAPDGAIGACGPVINPHHTGCIDPAPLSFQSGSFLPDGHHVLALVHFVGAPAAPDPASIYNGAQIIIVTTDGTRFPNGDPWRCLTCGVPGQNAMGIAQPETILNRFATACAY